MKITVDTNLLVRAAIRDDEDQAAMARRIMIMAESIVVPLPCVLEFVWVLRSVYGLSRNEVAQAVLALIDSGKVVADTMAIRAGLDVHAAGGDFADGIIASAGAGMGAEAFVSFDRKAVRHIAGIGLAARNARDLA